jgi:hypothetical protein
MGHPKGVMADGMSGHPPAIMHVVFCASATKVGDKNDAIQRSVDA